jgi:hypothetical protein
MCFCDVIDEEKNNKKKGKKKIQKIDKDRKKNFVYFCGGQAKENFYIFCDLYPFLYVSPSEKSFHVFFVVFCFFFLMTSSNEHKKNKMKFLVQNE